jgi:hypothetical protein
LGVATSTIAAETSSWFLVLAKLTFGVDLGVARNPTIARQRGLMMAGSNLSLMDLDLDSRVFYFKKLIFGAD